jgi:hypothetical protein
MSAFEAVTYFTFELLLLLTERDMCHRAASTLIFFVTKCPSHHIGLTTLM